MSTFVTPPRVSWHIILLNLRDDEPVTLDIIDTTKDLYIMTFWSHQAND